MGNIIIVEGIDRVGKTTLCNLLLKELKDFKLVKYDSEIIKCKDRQNDYETDKNLLTLEMCKIFDGSVLFDRLHLSDYVYGTIQRNYNKEIAKENFKKIEYYLLSNFDNVILVLMLPTDIKKSSEEHGKDLTEHNDIFMDLYLSSDIKNKYHGTYNDINFMVKNILDCVRLSNEV